MANYQIVRDQSKKVKEVCVDFRTREDEALAQRLQDEEFETHYLRNRNERGTARVDVKAAKKTYLQEVKSAGLLEDAEYQRLAEDDAWLACELQQRLDEEEKIEASSRAAGEMQDEEYAQLLQEKDRDRLEKARHRRLQNRIEQQRREMGKIERETPRGSAAQDRRPIEDQGQSHREARNEMALDDISKHVNDMKVSMPTSSRVNDIQNHQVQSFAGDSQNESFSEERNFEQELKDEEYARELQRREEEKLRKMMEERDRRLALKMQKKEAEQYRRQRAERELRRAATMPEPRDKDDVGPDQTRNGEERIEQRLDDSEQLVTPSQEAQIRRIPEQNHERPTGEEGSRTSSIASKPIPEQAEMRPPQRSRSSSVPKGGKNEHLANQFEDQHHAESNPQRNIKDSNTVEEVSGGEKTFMNVAACIDPTYKGEDSKETPHWQDRRWGLDNDDSSTKPAPVIQNTKRKKSSDKRSKEKGDKCKQQ